MTGLRAGLIMNCRFVGANGGGPMPNLGFQEIIVIFVIALLVFGPRKLPELGKSLGKGLREFRKATSDLKSSWEEQVRDIDKDVKETRRDFSKIGQDVRNDVRNTIHQPDKKTDGKADTAKKETSPPAASDSTANATGSAPEPVASTDDEASTAPPSEKPAEKTS